MIGAPRSLISPHQRPAHSSGPFAVYRTGGLVGRYARDDTFNAFAGALAAVSLRGAILACSAVITMRPKKVAILTAGGLAPCLSASIAGLIERYSQTAPEIEIICYRSGYKGLLLGDSLKVGASERTNAAVLRAHGGSPIGNSRVKLTNVKDCVKRGLVKEGQNPLQVAAEQLVRDGVDVLHTIGGDDTNTTAADLAAYLAKNNYQLTVIGLPKTIDNDVVPIRQSLGAWTAAE